MGEKSEGCEGPADLLRGLKVTDPQEVECAGPPAPAPRGESANSQRLLEGEEQEEECFHDCSASFEDGEPGGVRMEDKPADEAPPELDEEYLIELEKNMPDEEKQVSGFVYSQHLKPLLK